MWSLGRMGYSKKFPGNGDGGGINGKRLKCSDGGIDFTQIKKNFYKLLEDGKKGEAYSFIFNCGYISTEINNLIKKYF